MFKKIVFGILIALVVIVVVLAAVVAMQPADFRVERKATISAPPSVVFPHVNDFRKWEAWSPWDKVDPTMKRTFEGPAEGKGSIYKWAGNSEVGEGQMTILESRPSELVKIKLDFLKPMEATSNTDFNLKDEGNQTVVTWTMYGQNNFIAKAFHLFMNMDKMIGDDFDKGLASMKSVVEKGSK